MAIYYHGNADAPVTPRGADDGPISRGANVLALGGRVPSSDVTIKLLDAINDIKNHVAPDRYSPSA